MLNFGCWTSSARQLRRIFGKSFECITCDEDLSEVTLFDGFVLEGELEYELYGDFVAKLRAVTKFIPASAHAGRGLFL